MTSDSGDSKVNLKTITAHELLSNRANVAELFNLLDDSERVELIHGTPQQREENLVALKQKLKSLTEETNSLAHASKDQTNSN